MIDKILVIGSNSFSGAYFIKHILEKNIQVFGVSRSSEADKMFLPYHWNDNKKRLFSFYCYDLNHNLDEVINLIKHNKIRHIINFAAQSMVGQSWDYPEHWMQTNVVSTTKLFNQLKNIDFLDRYLHITTPEVYGTTSGIIDENAPYSPSTPYAVSRAAADLSINSFFSAYDFPFCATRASNVYGAGQRLYRIIPKAIYCALRGVPLELHGGGTSIRNFIHMQDVAHATFNLFEKGKLGEYYHISGDEFISIKDLVFKIFERVNAGSTHLIQIGEERLGKDAAYKLDCTKLTKEINWQPNISLDEGLNEVIKWMHQNLERMDRLPHEYEHKP